MIKPAKLTASRGHATTGAGAFLEHRDLEPGLRQRARAGNTRHAGAHHSNMPQRTGFGT